jgi:hypothetical protein
MHEPSGCRSILAAIEAMAIEPEAAAVRIFHDIIVAFRFAGAPPPLRRDAFGALRRCHLMRDAPPAKLSRRPFRYERDDFGGFGLRQEEKRA